MYAILWPILQTIGAITGLGSDIINSTIGKVSDVFSGKSSAVDVASGVAGGVTGVETDKLKNYLGSFAGGFF